MLTELSLELLEYAPETGCLRLDHYEKILFIVDDADSKLPILKGVSHRC